jgi:hypothetical protein
MISKDYVVYENEEKKFSWVVSPMLWIVCIISILLATFLTLQKRVRKKLI